MIELDTRLTRTTTWLAGVLAGLIMLAFPLVFFTLRYQFHIASMEVEAQFSAANVSKLINANPEFWQFEAPRLEVLLKDQAQTALPELRRIVDTKGRVIVQSPDPIATPTIVRTAVVLDSGNVVGRFEVVRSLRPLLLETALASLLGLLLGAMVLVVLRVYPLRALKRALGMLANEKERAEAILRSIDNAVITIDRKGMALSFNPAAEKIFGYAANEVIGHSIKMLMPQPYLSEHNSFLAALHAAGKRKIIGIGREASGLRKDGEIFPLDLSVSEVEQGNQRVFTGILRDITERKKAEAELLRFKNVLDNTLDMIFMFDAETLRFVYVNQGAALNMGYSRKELLGMAPCQIKPLLPEPEFRQLIAPLLSGEQVSLRFDTVHRRKDGTDFPVDIVLQLMRESDANRLFVAIVRDVTDKKKSDELIWQQANFDTLTGLPNRRMFYDRLEQEIKKSHRSGLPMALLLLDLDRFKEVNDTLGHAQGDVLLVEAARRIVECVRESDTVARLGGDEFTVILSEVEDGNSVERIAQNIIERLAAPFLLLQETVFVSASVGIALYPNDAQTIDTLITNADQAMYLSKNSGRGSFSYFTAALQEAAQTRLRLGNDLRNALAGKQLAVYYQPIVEIATGKIYKAEALLRWHHPERGMVSPMHFIPLAEESGLIHEMGDWVFHETARELARWRALFAPEFQISVNVSPVQFRQNGGDHASSWISHLRAMDLPGQSLIIEITEGVLLNAEINVTEKLLSFRDAGVQVALDDFGTGYSSLSYLKKFDIDYLKIDQSFVRNLEDDLNDKALCEAIIIMAHKLGLKVIAEGVETEQQRDLLAAYGCDYAQGYLYSKAVPPEQFEVLLQGQAK